MKKKKIKWSEMDKSNLYNLALQCAEFNDQGCACGCEQCQYNVFNYVDDVREASLLKANTYTDYYNQQAISNEVRKNDIAMTMAPLVLLGLLVVGLMWCCSSMKSCVQGSLALSPPAQEISMYNEDEVITLYK